MVDQAHGEPQITEKPGHSAGLFVGAPAYRVAVAGSYIGPLIRKTTHGPVVADLDQRAKTVKTPNKINESRTDKITTFFGIRLDKRLFL
jgi:hypothetical protein